MPVNQEASLCWMWVNQAKCHFFVRVSCLSLGGLRVFTFLVLTLVWKLLQLSTRSLRADCMTDIETGRQRVNDVAETHATLLNWTGTLLSNRVTRGVNCSETFWPQGSWSVTIYPLATWFLNNVPVQTKSRTKCYNKSTWVQNESIL